ncbi:MAG: hypothetical protein IPQ07_14830 [Myxococcales bacterium]|nr:hypothetical protein [Myxococcales bacterium]
MNVRSVLFVLLAAAGCAPSGPFVRVKPINSYRAYGEYHAQAQDDALVAKAASADVSGHEIHVFQEALPPGIEMKDGTFGVAAGYTHRLLGKYAYSSGKEVLKDELVATVKKMCVTAGANAAIIIFQLVPNDHQDRAQAIEAVLVDLHDKAPSESVGAATP